MARKIDPNRYIQIFPYKKWKDAGSMVYELFDLELPGTTYTYPYSMMISYKTDPVIVRASEREFAFIYYPEDLKNDIRKRFNVIPGYSEDHIGDGVLLGVPQRTVSDNELIKHGIPLLSDFIKQHKKITRKCDNPDCENKITIYKSNLIRGKGLYCNDCIELKLKLKSVSNICGNCQIEYKSHGSEDYCSEECENYYHEKENILPVINDALNIVDYEKLSNMGSMRTLKKHHEMGIEPYTSDDSLVFEGSLSDKITRNCIACGNKIHLTKGDLVSGNIRKLFCSDKCFKPYISFEKRKINNHCLSCGLKYDSLIQEYNCSDECDEYYLS